MQKLRSKYTPSVPPQTTASLPTWWRLAQPLPCSWFTYGTLSEVVKPRPQGPKARQEPRSQGRETGGMGVHYARLGDDAAASGCG